MVRGNRISKVITRTGDAGQTALVGGARVSKASPRVDAYGEVDELNSLLGLVRARLNDAQVDDVLRTIQNDLFTLGADLASPAEIEVPRITEAYVETLEAASETFLAELEPLKEFILPGGSEAGASLHVARAVARRAERRVVALADQEAVNAAAIVYLNRLSDLLFIMARAVNHRAGAAEKMTDFSKRTNEAASDK
ncbi:MAG TPA: cob(I)yrinic acid a,c-diamide adenosyltransferase [Blastocatellia bacterium]|nr:cob(I)yrinic acid a,c-diamide adenosyltransferase [Blastocatellia bacterium]